MGNLVFQATLGGQVNLVGPNTASTYNIAVPAVSGTMVTTGDTGTVTNTMLAGSIANAKLLNSSVTIGSTAVSLGSTVTAFTGITTLAMSGNLTLSGGTANGVAYLNGSNVVTTGTALTFDGTNLKNNQSTASPVGLKLNNDSASTSAGARLTFQYNSGDTGYVGNQFDGTDFNNQYAANRFHIWSNNGSEQMRLTSTGLGIGTSSPAYKLDVLGSSTGVVKFTNSGAKSGWLYSDSAGIAISDTADLTKNGLYINNTSNYIALYTGATGAERARIDSSGNLLVGETTAADLSKGFSAVPGTGSCYATIGHASGTASGYSYLIFGYNSSNIGSITQSGTTGVLYNITSDYRLKEVIGSVSGSGERIDALQPIDYTMKADGSQHRGFLAHQFQEVYANSVSGVKDAVDADGKPIYQQMQAGTAEVIADLVAEIQSLRARLKAANIA